MTDTLRHAIRSVFSVLPEDLAHPARQDMFKQLYTDKEQLADELKWVEIGDGNKVVRSGATDLSGFTRIFVQAGDHCDTASLATQAQHGVHPGEIRASSDQQILYWFVAPAFELNKATSLAMKGLAISQGLFFSLCDIFARDVTLTTSEKRVIFQLCMGISLRDAAAYDEVAFETKRSQVKHACSKLSCHSQADLSRIGIGMMSGLLSLAGLHGDAGQVIEHYAAKFLDQEVRLVLQQLPNGRVIRYFDVGPPDGDVILVMHGMLFPLMLNNVDHVLQEAKLRLIMPIRQGYLDGNSPKQLLQSDELVAQSLEDAATLARNHLPAPLTVLGNSYGGSMAVRFAAAYPDVVSSLVILSINAGLKGRSRGFSLPLYEGLQALSNKPGIIRLMTWRFRQFYAERKTAHGVLSQMFSASSSDMKVIDRLLSSEPSADWFSQLFQTSVNGIAEDFRFAAEEWQHDLVELRIPITFVHGEHDPIISVERLQSIADSKNQFDMKLVEGGHLICASHPLFVWQAVAQCARHIKTCHS